MTGSRRPASAPATSGRSTASNRNSTKSAFVTRSRSRRSSAIVGATMVTESADLVAIKRFRTTKKPLQPAGQEIQGPLGWVAVAFDGDARQQHACVQRACELDGQREGVAPGFQGQPTHHDRPTHQPVPPWLKT